MKLRITVDSRVHFPVVGIPDAAIADLLSSFRHANPEYAKKRALGISTYGVPREYKTFRQSAPTGVLSVPRGGLARVRATLDAHGVAFKCIDERTEGVTEGAIPKHRFTLYDYQADALEAAIEKQNCLVRAPTGGGKTCVAFGIAARVNLPTLVIVWSGALYDQWLGRAEEELGLLPSEVGTIRAGKVRLKPLTIAMQQSLAQILSRGGQLAEDIKRFPGTIICDEVQRFAAKTLFDAIDPFAAKYRIGISGDETRKDRKEFLIYDLFGPIAADVSRKKLIEEGHIIDVEVRIVPTAFDSRCPPHEFDDLLKEMTGDEERNAIVEKLVAGEHERGEQVLVMSHRREHCAALDARISRMGIKSGLMLGGVGADAKIFEKSKAGIKNGEYRAAVGTYQAVGTGIDMPRLAVGIATTPLASNRQQCGQVWGRFCRKGKETARLYYLWDRSYYGLRPVENLNAWFTSVVVLDRGKWVNAKEFIRGIRNID